MGCPMCDWKTAILMVVGIALLFVPGVYFTVAGIGFMITAWVWALWPKKTCRLEPRRSGRDPKGAERDLVEQ